MRIRRHPVPRRSARHLDLAAALRSAYASEPNVLMAGATVGAVGGKRETRAPLDVLGAGGHGLLLVLRHPIASVL